uniref:Secreted protein n=1 Tax=Anguilla anguilla TaxID=7936 RepID=A0A0E9WWT2_ANGAN
MRSHACGHSESLHAVCVISVRLLLSTAENIPFIWKREKKRKTTHLRGKRRGNDTYAHPFHSGQLSK